MAATVRRRPGGFEGSEGVPAGGASTSTAEYDAFGPWVDPVRGPEQVPRLFRDHPIDLDAARMVLKVPRDIARRDATPDMDLYDHLLVLGPDRFTALSRREGARYDVREVPYDGVAAVATSVDLLDGRLTVHALTGAPVSVRFGGSSADVVQGFLDLLRLLAWPAPAGAAPRDPGPGIGRLGRRALGEQEIGLVGAYREVADADPALRTLAAHARVVVAPAGGPVRRALHVLRPMTVQGAVIGSDGRELQVFGRRAWLVRGRTPVHSESRLVLPLDRLTGVATARHPGYPGVEVVTLRAGDAAVELPVPAGSDARRVLAGLAPAA